MKALGIFFLTIMISTDVIVLTLSIKTIMGLIPFGLNAVVPVCGIAVAICIPLGLTALTYQDVRADF